MKLLLFLNKFDINENILYEKINLFIKVEDLKKDGDVVLINAKNIDIQRLLALQEIKKIVELKSDWEKLDFKNLKEYCFKAIKGYNSYLIKTNFLNKIPISAKSIYKEVNPYLKHEGFIVDENKYDVLLHLEFKKINGKIFYRTGMSSYDMWNKIKPLNINLNNINIILEEPRISEEVSDFMRICYIFKIKFSILTENNEKIEKIINNAKKITKGIDYSEFKIALINSIPEDSIKIAFSKHSKKNEIELIKFFKENKNKDMSFIFGNDTYGLSQKVRDKSNCDFRLTPETKKPLKANQSLSYIIGLLVSVNIQG